MTDYPLYSAPVPYITTEQMIEVDRAMIEDYQIDLVRMMENAGRNLAHLARTRFLDGDPRGKLVVVLAGTGGNGGGALVCARRLHNYGAKVVIFTTKWDTDFAPIPAQQLAIVRRMGIIVRAHDWSMSLGATALIIDGVIGYSLQGSPRGAAADLIRWTNNTLIAPVLALDTPSGVNASSGKVYKPAIRADATLTLALPKTGLRAPGVADHVGELYLADISVPTELYATLGLDVPPIFAHADIVRLS